MEKLNAVWCFIQTYNRFHESLCPVVVKPWNICHHSRQGKWYVNVSRTHIIRREAKTSRSRRGKQGLQGAVGIRPGWGLLSPKYLGRWQATPPLATVCQEGCPILPWANTCPRLFKKVATWRSCVTTTYEDDVSWRMKNSICPALLRSFGPVLIFPCCPRVCSLLSQHEGTSQELINFSFQEDIFRELRHIRMYWNGAQWNFTDFKLRHTQADSVTVTSPRLDQKHSRKLWQSQEPNLELPKYIEVRAKPHCWSICCQKMYGQY